LREKEYTHARRGRGRGRGRERESQADTLLSEELVSRVPSPDCEIMI